MKTPMIIRALVILILSICWPTLSFAVPDYSKTPVFFVHGYGVPPSFWNAMISVLTNSGYPPNYLRANQFSSVSNGNIYAAENEIAPDIESFLTEINTFLASNFPNLAMKTKVDLVSHSMGGLTSRWYAAKVRPDRVRKWVSLAGANHGTNDVCPPEYPTAGADDLCPAYANSAEESLIQYELNGAPYLADVDETPFGIGVDSAGVASVAPDSNRRILYVTIRTSPDIWIDPEDSVILDGAGGVPIPIPGDLPAQVTSDGNILMTNGVGHDPMLWDPETIRLVEIILTSIIRVDIDRKIRGFKEGNATEQEVKDLVNEYMETN